MHPSQKAAWFTLIVFAATIILYLAAVPLLAWLLQRPWTEMLLPASGVFGFTGLSGFTRAFYRPRGDGLPVVDERDQLIAAKAWRAGMGAFWGLFVLGCMGSWATMRYLLGMHHVTLPVEFFPWMLFVGFIVALLVQAVATLHYYGWRANHAADR